MFEKLLARTARALYGARIPYLGVGGQAVLLKNPSLDRDLIRDNLAEFERALAEAFVARFDALLP